MSKPALVLILLLTFLDGSRGQNTPAKQPPIIPKTLQEVSLLFAGQPANNRILMTLNNNRAAETVILLTLYPLSGHPIELPSLTLGADESRVISMGDTLNEAGIRTPLGYLRIRYMGYLMEVGAQLTLYPSDPNSGLDSPRSLSVDFRSTGRQAVAWMPPQSHAVIALSNTTETSITAHVTINGVERLIWLGPHETQLQDEASELLPKLTAGVLSCSVVADGPVDGVRAFGYIQTLHSGSLPIRFYDTETSTMPDLVATGLRTDSSTHIAVQNVTETSITVTPHFSAAGTAQPDSFDGPSFLMKAHDAVEKTFTEELTSMRRRGIVRTTLTLRNSGLTGSLIGAATQLISAQVLEDVPLRTSNGKRYMRGVYPLRWAGDYTNLPMVANVSTKAIKVRSYVIAGGQTYVLPIVEVQPDTTFIFDIDHLRVNHSPDVNGKIIPLTASSGKFHWAPVDGPYPLGLIGRTELASAADHRASSFSCGQDCVGTIDQYPFYDNDPFSYFPDASTTGARSITAHETYFDHYGNQVTYPNTSYSSYPWSVADTSVLAMTPMSDGYTLRADTGNPGDTQFQYHFYSVQAQEDDEGTAGCTYPDYGQDQQKPVSVVARVVNFHQTIGRDNGGGVIAFEYHWESSTGSLQDLNQCSVREVVTYPLSPGPYYWKSPPYALSFHTDNPDIEPASATGGVASDHHIHSSFRTPYVTDMFTANQKYQYSCTNYNNGAWNDLVTGLSIVRTVTNDGGWRYTVTKSGVSATIPLP